MIMRSVLTCILVVSMCRTSTGCIRAAFTATFPLEKISCITVLNAQPVPTGSIVKYGTKLINGDLASNYDPVTSIYTVPLNGIYKVTVTMMSGLVTGHTTLRKNGEIVVWLFTSKEYDMATQSINLQMQRGDKLWVQMNNGSSLFSVYNTFSAVLITLT
ncbi:complement C1q-like protein 2 [Mytilus edulis]|uniref:complement C1q-like protein 2 n=1 Tax=Mytilus edulis TaxID=6550 RepID=UPI0039EF8781